MFALCFALLQLDLSQLPWSELAQLLLQAVTAKNWWLVTGLGVWATVAALKQWGAKLPFVGEKLAILLAKKWTLPVLALLLSLAGGLVNLVMAGASPTWGWALTVLINGFTAIAAQELKNAALKAGSTAASEIKSVDEAVKFFKEGK